MSNSAISLNRPERNYGLDFMRFISMLMIVCLHVLGNGGLLSNAKPLTIQGETIWFLEIACCCSVNCFALISGYLGVHSKHKWKNIISLSVQALFYCFLFTSVYICNNLIQGDSMNKYDLLRSFIPALSGRYWYFSAYFCLFFFMPILDRVADMPKPILKRAAILIFFVFCCVSQLKDKVSSLSAGYSFLWLAILYVVGGYISKHNPLRKLSPLKSVVGYILCVAVTLGSKILASLLNIEKNTILVSYTSPTIVLASLFLLNAFINWNINKKYRKGILFLSSCSFGVYLIHCQPIVYDHFLKNSFTKIANHHTIIAVLMIIAACIAIYLVCAIIEYLRKYVFKWTKMDIVIDRISELFTKVFAVIEGENKQ